VAGRGPFQRPMTRKESMTNVIQAASDRSWLVSLCRLLPIARPRFWPDLYDRLPATVVKESPTQPGDALILRTSKSYTIYAVGPVSRKGQQDFKGEEHVGHVSTRDAAVSAAAALVAPLGQIYLLDIDTGDWSEISQTSGRP